MLSALVSMYNCDSCSTELDMDFRGIPTANDISYQGSVARYQDCCDLCTANPNCKAWTYVFDTQVCWLKNSVGYRLATLGRISGLRKGTTTTTGGSCNIESEYVYQNNDMGQPLLLPVGSNQFTCCTQCSQTTGCVAWSYLTVYRYCYLKNALPTLANRLPYAQSFSGTLVGNTIATTTVAPAVVSTGCTYENGYVYQNNDISQPLQLPAGSTQTTCCDTCRSTSGCVAWSYLPTYRYCYLKNVVHTLANRVAYAGAVSGVTTTGTTGTVATSTCTVTSGNIYPGSDLSGSYLASSTDCCNSCGATAGCVAWDYLNDFHYCYLKTALPTDARRVTYLDRKSVV